MPARRKTRAELELSGATRKDPKRYRNRADVPVSTPLGYPPRSFNVAQKSIWRELIKLSPPGVLTGADRFALELAVRMVERSRTESVKASEVAVLLNLLGRLGLTPADRARLDIASEPDLPESDPWAAFDVQTPGGSR